MNEARQVDESIRVSSDLFNADTMAIIERKKLIDSNPDIENKPYFLANQLIEQFRHNKQVIFEANETIIKASNEQKAIQVYLNNLANSLRQEEREKLKISDINYKPESKVISRPKAPSRTKLDLIALKKAASELGVSLIFIQQLVISKGISIEQAVDVIKKSIESAKSVQQGE